MIKLSLPNRPNFLRGVKLKNYVPAGLNKAFIVIVLLPMIVIHPSYFICNIQVNVHVPIFMHSVEGIRNIVKTKLTTDIQMYFFLQEN